MTLVVLAAGMGSRFGGLKQLEPITEKGEFIIDFSIYDAIRAGADRVIFIIKRENQQIFHDSIGRRVEKHIKVEYAYQDMDLYVDVDVPAERVKPWGTAHALIACLDMIQDEPFMVINADDFYGRSAYEVVANYLNSVKKDGRAHFCMAGYVLDNTLTDNGTVSRGECTLDANSNLVNIVERTKIRRKVGGAEYADGDNWVDISPECLVSMNFFGFTPEILHHARRGFAEFLRDESTDMLKGEYFLPLAVKQMLDANTCDVRVLRTTDRWYGVTYREDKESVVANVKAMIDEGKYPNGLWN